MSDIKTKLPPGGKPTQKVRDANFELLRIVSMLMVLCLHFNKFGSITKYTDSLQYPKEFFFFNFVEYACFIAVNLFVMITGYYMINKQIKLSRAVSLWNEVAFYSVSLYLIVTLGFTHDFTWKGLVESCFVVLFNRYWFMSAYLALFLTIPFLNKLLDDLDRNRHLLLVLLLTVFLVLIPIKGSTVFESRNGYSYLWFLYLYIVGGFIRHYWKLKINKLLLCAVFVAFASLKVMIKWMEGGTGNYRVSYNNVFIVIETLAVFLFFKDLNIKNRILSKCIIAVSPLTLAVYLIHIQKQVSPVLWKALHPYTYVGTVQVYGAFVVDVLGIFIVCCAIEKLRQILFKGVEKLFRIDKLYQRLDSGFSKIMYR